MGVLALHHSQRPPDAAGSGPWTGRGIDVSRRDATRGAGRPAGLIRLAASPVFLLLAAANFVSRDSMEALMVVNCRNPISDMMAGIGLEVPEAVFAALGSMWLMYLLMGLFHLGVWLDLLSGRRGPSEG